MFNCCTREEGGCVIGVERTFNLGACYVTCMVYQDLNLKRKSKNNVPILLGQIYLHWDGSFVAYQRFFSHIAAVFKNNFPTTILNLKILIFEERLLLMQFNQVFYLRALHYVRGILKKMLKAFEK